ncbi:MAG: protein kinase [Acidobacteria bacterium]|nr:protein kinase [Acidobacteriota bacterium]MBK8150757.1 protein kinase [Acidobacteriota bacterium]MBK8812249.1 protein kinase [Acidobacteriota bacterium]
MLDQFVGKVLAEKYRIDSVMRDTDLGRIYHGTHLLMDKNVAVKVLSPALAVDESIVNRFSREARAVSNISHPNLLNVTDFGSDADGTVFIVFEDADGQTLRKLLAHGEEFSATRAVKIVRQVASALSAGHIKGLVHRHLTTDNILVNQDDEVKLLDLGAGSEPVDGEYTTDRIRYLSPEQCADPSNGDERSDIYSLGVIFYEMLAGETPFQAENTNELMLKHAQEPPPPLTAFRKDLPPEIEPVILQTLAKNPDMRHQTAVELIDDLNRASRGFVAAPANERAEPGSPNNIWKTAFVVLAGISLLSAGLIWATSGRKTDPSTYQSDANAMPVQPIGPATGMNEQGLSNIAQVPLDFSNSNMMLTAPDTLSGGTSNPLWDQNYVPQGPVYIPPAGNQVTVGPCDPNNPFMPCDTVVVQQPSNTATNTTPSPKPTKSPAANTAATPAATETPKPQPSPTVAPAKTPQTKPSEQKTPASSTKKIESGKTQDSR